MDKKIASRICGTCFSFRRELQEKNSIFSIGGTGWPEDTEILFIKNLDRALVQLELELKSDNYYFLPELNDADGEVRLLEADIESCIVSLRAGGYEDASFFLKRIVGYQMRHGFWNQHPARSNEGLDKEIKKAVSEARAIFAEAKMLRSNIASEREMSVSMRVNMESNTTEGLKRISKASSEAAVKLADIESVHSSVRVYAEDMPKIISESNGILASLKAVVMEEERNLSDMALKREELLRRDKEAQDKIEAALISFSEKLVSVEEAQSKVDSAVDGVMQKESYFEERNRYLDDLIGREVGSSLFETFKQRKQEISGSIGFWKWSVLVVTVATVMWIFFLFGVKDVSAMSWQMVFVNTVKSIPVVALLLFAISQYSKERNFQEEYAFKSAVALTINSYANQLDDKGNRDRLVMESVGEIYQSPIHKTFKINSAKEFSGAVKGLSDTVKGLKGE